MSTIYASFISVEAARKAVGALMDQGAKQDDISLVANVPPDAWRAQEAESKAQKAEGEAKSGITTTTGGDAAIGAEKGALYGAGLGVLAALTALAIPGIGIVVGGGALVAAIAGAAGTTAAGAVAGGIAGYLDDQGMGPELVTHYSTAFERGDVIVGIAVPSGSLLPEFAEQILAKYGATNVATYNGSRDLMDTGVPKEPMVVQNPNLDPLVVVPTQAAVVDTRTEEIAYVPTEVAQRATIRPVEVDPVTGHVTRAMLVDPLTGFERPIRYHEGMPVYSNSDISEHSTVTQESDTILNADDPTRPTVTLTGSERVTIL